MGQHAYAPIRWFFRVSLLMLTLNVGATILTDPAVVTTAGTQALVYLVLFILAILIYSWVALVRTRAATPAERIAVQQGTFWGLLCGGAWIIELLVANL